ncbi:electron transfer flavoprotein subunit alpha/FixB family protein [Corallincola holothuriorum]|uniref:Electron transfer flavoprotein subunit alpha n=1 Tax=Corallincola holothuriorum TaxID=2282215 RepID=A0A368NJR5_9GAMM|nr:FAD-binding protein [Corallincola holothuriorum]RCU49601.1 electron transfer flavoprotein subunit alpha/FixB family protein [Corallincola holothuriorum]
MAVLVIAEIQGDGVAGQRLSEQTCRAVTAAQQLSDNVDLLLWGTSSAHIVDQLQGYPLGQIHLLESAAVEHGLAESLAPVITALAVDYQAVVAGSSTFAKDLLPRVAAMLDVGMTSDVIAIESEDTFIRPMYAGNAIAKVRSHDAIKVITIRSAAFALPLTNGCDPVTVVRVREDIAALAVNDLSSFVSEQITESERPELSAAKVVVSGGRGLQSAEQFHLVEQLADKLNGAVGASRAAVDAGFIGNDFQVGQTGKIVAPDLYIALGISGAIQHIAGMKDAKVVVAINKDADAPIFDVADYGLVGDLFDLVPEMIKRLPQS